MRKLKSNNSKSAINLKTGKIKCWNLNNNKINWNLNNKKIKCWNLNNKKIKCRNLNKVLEYCKGSLKRNFFKVSLK